MKGYLKGPATHYSFVLAALTCHWDKAEYAADFIATPHSRARSSLLASWLHDADTELLDSYRHRMIVAEGKKNDFSHTGEFSSRQVVMRVGIARRSMMSAQLYSKGLKEMLTSTSGVHVIVSL